MTLMLPIPNPCLCRILCPMPLMPYTTLMLPIPNPCLWHILRPMPLMPHMPLMPNAPYPEPVSLPHPAASLREPDAPNDPNALHGANAPYPEPVSLAHPEPAASSCAPDAPNALRDPHAPYPEPVSLAHPAANGPIASLPEPAAPVAAKPRTLRHLMHL